MSLVSDAEGQTIDSSLKLAFQRTRASGNIEDLLPVLRVAMLYVVAGSSGTPNDLNDLFLTESPTNGRFCITVADAEKTLAEITWPKRVVSGEHILRHLPSALEVIVVYADGGDYITRETMQRFREMLDSCDDSVSAKQ